MSSVEKLQNNSEQAPKTPETLTDVQQNFLANFKDNPEKMWEIIEKNTPLPSTKAESELLALKDRDPVATADEVLLAIQKISKEKQETLLAELAKSEKTNETNKEKFTITAVTTNAEFLNVPFSNRLPAITKPPIETAEIKSGTEIKLNFDYDGDEKQDNSEFYRKTTAGQILPENVMAVKSNNQEYKRDSLKGEFFDENGRRLIIRHNTILTVSQLRSKEQLKVKHKENKEKFEEFQEKNPNANKMIIKEALARGIDPQFAILAFSDKTKKAGIEDAFTEFDRVAGKTGLSRNMKNGKYSTKLLATLLEKANYNKKQTQDIVQQYGAEPIVSHKQKNNVSITPKQKTLRNSSETSDIARVRSFFRESKDYKLPYKQADNLAKSYQFFIDKGLTKNQSAGIVANMHHESRGSTTIPGDNGKAFGLVQMHEPRRSASGYGYSLESQLNAIIWEFKHSPLEIKAYKKLVATRTAYDAANVFMEDYERPHKSLRNRERARRGKTAEDLIKYIT